MTREKVSDYYADYLRHLIDGDRLACEQIIRACIDQNLPYADIYSDLIQNSLYEVGELWAN
ncbi:MAG TPA: B12-binding domain-containing protein, partial [Turneriella sp.]|nr:B12-binding domain-containing protein [Turneriella sp.]